MRPEYLYLHAPFCARRCSYCDVAVEVEREPPVEAWLDAVERELAMVAEVEGWGEPLTLRTLYVGGGTPSLLGAPAMESLRRRLEPFATVEAGTEWTVEANPESFDAALAHAWQEAGVNRLSLGVQTFHESALRWLGRLHDADGSARAVEAARAAGFDNYSVDLIFGLPERLGRDWGADLEGVLGLEPTHVSLFELTAEPATPLGQWVAEGREQLPEEDRYVEEYTQAAERLGAAGFVHYEVSNFARPDCESRHNRAYWTGEAYLGLGPSAHTYLPPVRRWNLREWPAYRNAMVSGTGVVAESERVDGDSARLEQIWLGLRTRAGVPRAECVPAQERLAHRWAEQGLAQVDEDTVRLTLAGWLVLDRLVVEFDAAGHEGMT